MYTKFLSRKFVNNKLDSEGENHTKLSKPIRVSLSLLTRNS
jgi:hypothetical protein